MCNFIYALPINFTIDFKDILKFFASYLILSIMTTVTELLKKKLGRNKLATAKDGKFEPGGNIKLSDVKAIAKEKFGSESFAYVKMVIGTCQSCGVTIDGKPAKEVIEGIE